MTQLNGEGRTLDLRAATLADCSNAVESQKQIRMRGHSDLQNDPARMHDASSSEEPVFYSSPPPAPWPRVFPSL